jgi:uncharacterized protein YggE
MAQRILAAFGVLAAVLLLAVLAGIVGVLYARPATASTSAIVDTTRRITVIGHGEAVGQPDIATVQIGIETDAPSVGEALAQNNARAQAIQAKLKELGVADKDIQTNNFSISPSYGPQGMPGGPGGGYHVSNGVSVTIRNLDQAGALLDQVAQAGANNIYGPSFRVSEPKALLEEARAQAIEDAKARAAHMARVSGRSVGDVVAINENVAGQPMMMDGMAAPAAAGAVPVQPGEQRLGVDLQVTFELR